ncbi:MAG: PilZ domain-containing protein [Myxococcota bacterium]
MSERRRAPRRRVQKTSALLCGDDRALYARIHDASEGGLSVRVPAAFRVGDLVVVTIDARIHLRARVTRSGAPSEAGVGLEVTEILEGAEEYRKLVEGP